jgi:Ribbon-helix-helix protein, copG family
MKKTSVYLSDDEAERLRRFALATGRPQSDLIRRGIELVINGQSQSQRIFRSMGKGHGGGAPYAPWTAEELHDSALGRR